MKKDGATFYRWHVGFGQFVLATLTVILLSSFRFALAIAPDELTEFVKQVQQNSQRSYDEINSVTFEGRSKTYIYFGYGPFDIKLIPFMEDYYFNGIWMKPDSLRIIIKALRTVEPDTQKIRYGGFIPLPNPFQFTYDPSAFGINRGSADSTTRKKWPLYPFAIGADSVYHYEKINEIGFGENKVVTIKVTPTKSYIPAVSGKFMVDVNKQEVVGSEVIFNEAASYTQASMVSDKTGKKRSFTFSLGGSENHKVKTEKVLLYESYWLPAHVEEEFEIHWMGIKLKIYRLIEFTNYEVNAELPDSSKIIDQKVVYQIDPELEKKVIPDTTYRNRLTKEEQDQIIKQIEDRFLSAKLLTDLIQSDAIAEQAVKIGWEQRVGPYFHFAQQIANYFRYNRVEGLAVRYGFNLSNLIMKNSAISVNAGYGFKDQRWKGDAALLVFLNHQKNVFIETNVYRSIGYEEPSRLITTGKNTFTSLLYKGDYRDYYYKQGANLGLGFLPSENLAMKLLFVSQEEKSAANHTRFSLFKYSQPFRLNPEIAEGRFNGLQATLLYRIYNFDLDLLAEYTDMKNLGSDFSYAFIKGSLQKRFRPTEFSDLTFFTAGAAATGKLAPQRWFDFGGKTFLNYHGNLRGADYKAFTGDRMVNATLEYAINGSEFYHRGLKAGLVKGLKLHLWSGIGWSKLSERSQNFASNINAPTATTEGIYHEFGLGLSDRLNILRVDVVWNNVEKNKLLLSVNVLR
ncbi:MAG: DUF5686 family protein [candidate division KSB1 bacterium]|nr:DUF5686 family protein [candidate division KSB1 bacterium]